MYNVKFFEYQSLTELGKRVNEFLLLLNGAEFVKMDYHIHVESEGDNGGCWYTVMIVFKTIQ